jgi:hypothetical protein
MIAKAIAVPGLLDRERRAEPVATDAATMHA